MNNLVFLEPNTIDSEPFTTSDIIAEKTGNSYRSVQRTIERQMKRLESFGRVRFEITPLETKGGVQQHKIYCLNEPQATLLITFLRNTDLVADFKTELVRQFYAMRNELLRRQIERASLKPVRREMTDVIQEYDDGKWSYKKYTDLAYKSVLGKNAAQIRKERGALPKAKAVDYLTADEFAAVTKGTYQISVLLEKTQDYKLVKALMLSDTLPTLQAKAPR